MVVPDDELMLRIRQRDRKAFDELFVRYEPSVRTRLRRMVQDSHAAEDLLQEVFFRVWEKAETYGGRGPVAGWVYRIAFNLALNHIRTIRRTRELPIESIDNDYAEEEAGDLIHRIAESATRSPEAELERAELKHFVEELVRDLPESKRDALTLVHGQDLTVDQAAVVLGIPPGTVKSRLFYGRRALERRLREFLSD